MDPNKKRKYAQQLLQTMLARDTQLSEDLRYEMRNTPTGSYILNLTAFDKVLTSLLKDEEWGKKFTQETISKDLKSLLYNAFEAGQDRKNAAIKRFDELVKKVEEFSTQRYVYLPMVNIDLRLDQLKIGNITLLKMTEERIEDFKKRIDLVVKSTKASEETKAGIAQGWVESLGKEVCAEYVCIAEAGRAVERAHEELQRVLDLLRFMIYLTRGRTELMHIGRRGEVKHSILDACTIVDQETFSYGGSSYGALIPYVITERTQQDMEATGIFKVGAILEQTANLKQNTKEVTFDEMLLRSLRWFSNAQMQSVQENKFLNLMTCLETFLTKKNMEQITRTVAEGTAFVLADNIRDRKRLKKRILDLYDNRSRISHGGHSAMLQSDLDELQAIVAQFIEVMIQRSGTFKTQKDLEEWIDEQKFSAPETKE